MGKAFSCRRNSKHQGFLIKISFLNFFPYMEDTIVRVIGGPDDYSLRICIYLQHIQNFGGF